MTDTRLGQIVATEAIVALARAMLEGREKLLWGCHYMVRLQSWADLENDDAFLTIIRIENMTDEIPDEVARGGPVPRHLRRAAARSEALVEERKTDILDACAAIARKYSPANLPLLDFLNRNFARDRAAKELRFDDQIFAHGRTSQALLHAPLFMPPLAEIDGSVLLAWSVPADTRTRFADLKRKGDKPLAALEAEFNLVEVGLLFDDAGRDVGPRDLELLAGVLGEAWRRHLGWSFPSRAFTVEVVRPDEESGTVGLRFFEKR